MKKKVIQMGLLVCSGILLSGYLVPISSYANGEEHSVPNTEDSYSTAISENPAPALDVLVESDTDIIDINTTQEANSDEIVKTVIGEEDVVLATEINNEDTGEVISVVNIDGKVVIQKSTLLEDGTYEVKTETVPVSRDTISIEPETPERAARLYYAPWTYTNFAVGRNVFATIVDMALGSWVSYVAGLFRISKSAADFMFGYMGARGISAGDRLARIFDSNGNGWVALYTRKVYHYKGSSMIGTQHRTY